MACIVWNRNRATRRRLWLKGDASDVDRFRASQATIVIVIGL